MSGAGKGTENIEETVEDACNKLTSNFQSKFPHVKPITATDYIERYSQNSMLIDCRTKPERDVSIIQGAIPFDEINLEELRNQPVDKPIVMYCSVGFRSGLEGERLQDILGTNRNILNMQGILSYTHVLKHNPEAPAIVDPSTQQSTKQVHVFAKSWDFASRDYTTQEFPPEEREVYSQQIQRHVMVRKIQHTVNAFLQKACGCQK